MKNSVKIILFSAITLFLIVAFIQALAGQIGTSTQKAVVTDTFSKPTAGDAQHLTKGCPASSWRGSLSECYLELLSITNGTDNLEETTDYTFYENNGVCTGTSDGDIVFENTEIVNSSNKLYVTYSYCQDGYVTNGWQKVTLKMVPGLYALAILLVIVGGAFALFKEFKE